MPPRWRSSIAVFRHDPPDDFQPLPHARVSYLKVCLTLAPFAPELPVEVVTRRFDSRLRRDALAGRVFTADIDDLTRTSTLRFPDGREELRQLDALGRTTSITLQGPGTSLGPASGKPGTVLCELAYLGPDRVHALLRENDAITRYHYDDEGRLTDLEHLDGETQAVLERTRLRFATVVASAVLRLKQGRWT